MAEKYFSGAIPARNSELKGEAEKIWTCYQSALDNFQVDDAIEAIKKINQLGDGYVEKNKPWELAKTDEKRLTEVIYNLLEVLRYLGLMLWPIMPETAEKILTSLGQKDFNSKDIKTLQVWGLLEPDSQISKVSSLFPRIQ
jgi:methionyl-tRNA synthetase